jgi:oligoendopeptidase F
MPSKKPQKKNFKYTPQTDLPSVAITETWDLATQYYRDDSDPRIEADIVAAESAYRAFAKKWRKKPFTTDIKQLLLALKDSETLAGNPAFSRPMRYYHLRTALNTGDTAAEKQVSLINRRLRKAADETLFFALELGKIDKKTQAALLKEPILKPYRYYLERLFAGARHHLTEAEEKIISLKSRQAYGRWADMTEKIVSQRHITWKGKSIALPEAIETINILPFGDKEKLWRLITNELKQISEVAEHEFNAIITDVRTEDELRGYQKPYSATALSYQDSETALENLVQAVSTEGFKLSREFYQLKAKFHGVDTLTYSQRNESAGADITISFADAVTICRDVFYRVHPDYGAIFDEMLTRGQLDVWPKAGKTGGAFMSAQTGHPINVMLNHVTDFKSLETLAHEMGHAIHAARSQENSPFYDGHSIITAETASTLFENLVFDAVYEQVDDQTKVTMLHDRLLRDISTIQRQIAFFNAELEIHETIHRDGGMSGEELATCMEKHLKSYLGKGVTVTKDDGYSYVYIGHLRYGFYVYSYAYGLMMSSLMAAHYREDKGYVTKIDQFLRSGETKLVKDIYRDIGIDTTKADTFTSALARMKADINRWKKLVK